MNHFDPNQGAILVRTLLSGQNGDTVVYLALDTGSTSTSINKGVLEAIGYDVETLSPSVMITTGSGIENVPRLNVNSIEALGQIRRNYSLIAHSLPPTASVDGLLGLDFFRNHILTLDFKNGQILLE
ncbi:MAG: retropepsin-like aspartic protease [Chthonomonadales bacterium]